jgi:CO dehydrogenase nickel-insertion accessory protein CooC1
VDTPGAGSLYEHHDALLHAFIPQADAVIFLVTARMPLDEEELKLLKEVKKADIDKIFFVINKIDESEADEIDAAVSHNRQQLAHCNITPEGFHKISAKYAYINKPESNVPELITDINRFLEEHKGAVIRKRFISKVSGIVASELRTIEVTYSSGTKSEAELDTDIAHLQKQKKELGSKREFQEKEFGRKWKESVEDFASQLGKAEKSITAEVTEKINNTGTVGVGKLVKELPTFLNKSITDVFTPITERFETAAQKACEGLDTEYPVLTNDDAGRIVFRSQRDMTAATGLIGGGALAATGIGVVSAGAATAATIAATNTAALAAAASAGASAASTAALLGGLGVLLDSASVCLIGMPIGGTLMGGAAASAGAGAVAAPTLLTTPLWVALAGPVGWTLAGVGVLAVPFAWRLSKLKQKDKLEDEARKQIEKIFKSIREDRIPALRKMGISILERFKNNLDYQIKELEDALNNAKANRPGKTELSTLKQQSEKLNRIIAQSTEWINTTV